MNVKRWRAAERRVEEWITARRGRVARFQRAAWRAWGKGESGLIHAPTGSGKTLAAFGGPMIAAIASAGHVEVLVTTPESLALQLSYEDAVSRFEILSSIVVDEWHELLGSKRGVLLELRPSRRSCKCGAVGALVFTNTRSQAELWHDAVSVWPYGPETLAIHHGSLDRGLRRKVEEDLRSGAVRCVVAASSLDLGIDFSSVDAVIQIGSARGIARLLQRAGRSNHRPGQTARILCVPTHSLELAEIAAARRAARPAPSSLGRPCREEPTSSPNI